MSAVCADTVADDGDDWRAALECAASECQPPRSTNRCHGGSGCGLLGAYGSFGLLTAAPCGGQALSLQFRPLPMPIRMGPGFPVPIFSSSDTVPVRRGTTVGYMINAPAGITINSASISQGQTYGISDGQGWSAYTFRAGRIAPLHSFQVATDAAATADSSLSSSYFGVAMKCDWVQCTERGPAQPDQDRPDRERGAGSDDRPDRRAGEPVEPGRPLDLERAG